MNILFALYNHYSSNSGIHVACLVRELSMHGHDCVVAVPGGETGSAVKPGFAHRVLTFPEVERACQTGGLFKDGRRIDIFHAWTPREIVRKFHARMLAAVGGGTIVHLEDNEDELVKLFLGNRTFELALAGRSRLQFPQTLTHPAEGRRFLGSVQGVTVLIDALRAMVPDNVPTQLIWPAADDCVFYPRQRNLAMLTRLSVPASAVVLVYTGNAHPANAHEVRSLYLATHLLNRRGIVTRLIRTGKDSFTSDSQYLQWAGQYAIERGFIDRQDDIGELLALADVLVQPGSPGLFNDCRFPSKLPEFFASGRPVILPRTNIGLVTRHLIDAFVLDDANGPAIADAVASIIINRVLSTQLAKGARKFYEVNFSWKRSASRLSDFYQTVLKK